MSLLNHMNENDLFMSDKIAIERFAFLEEMIKSYPENHKLLDVYQNLIDKFFELEKQFVVSEQSVKEKDLEIDMVYEQGKIQKNE